MQRKHNLYRDSVVMHNSDPNLHLLAEGAPIDWGEEYGDSGAGGGDPGIQEAAPLSEKRRRAKQVVSVVQDEDQTYVHFHGSCSLVSFLHREEGIYVPFTSKQYLPHWD